MVKQITFLLRFIGISLLTIFLSSCLAAAAVFQHHDSISSLPQTMSVVSPLPTVSAHQAKMADTNSSQMTK